MKFFLGIVTIIFLVGCADITEMESGRSVQKTKIVTPEVLKLEDRDRSLIGWGIPLKNGVFVAPDHLWQTTGGLYFLHRPIKVLARDFRHDILFFRIKNTQNFKNPVWHDAPPAVGDFLWWFDGSEIHKTQVESVKTEFLMAEISLEDLCLVDGILKHGDSGSPIFNDRGEIYGFLTATDTGRKKSFVVRSDMVLDLAKEYLEP